MRYRRLHVDGACYFFTVVTERRRPLFGNPDNVALLDAVQALIASRHPFEIEAQVVMPDHIHSMWQLPPGDCDYAVRWRLIKSTFTHRFLKHNSPPLRSDSRIAKKEQAIWQRRYWEHLIHDDEDFAAHLDYIHDNPVRHGFASAPRDWQHSTFLKWVAKGVYEPEWGSQERPPLPTWAGKE